MGRQKFELDDSWEMKNEYELNPSKIDYSHLLVHLNPSKEVPPRQLVTLEDLVKDQTLKNLCAHVMPKYKGHLKEALSDPRKTKEIDKAIGLENLFAMSDEIKKKYAKCIWQISSSLKEYGLQITD